jgi:hypothetical protein
MSAIPAPTRKKPWHLWVVAILTFLWNGSGAFTIVMAQAGRLTDVDAQEAAYYAGQPTWFVVATDIALLLPLAAAVALLLVSRRAVWLFALSTIALIVNNTYDFAAGASLAIGDQNWLVLTAVIVAIATLQLAYASALRSRGVLQ